MASAMTFVAHTPNERGDWHLLEEHLRGTAERAREFGRRLHPEPTDAERSGELAYWAGLTHDIGKLSVRFQNYLRDQHAGRGRRGDGGDHKGAGALHSRALNQSLAFLVAGHHGGLQSLGDLKGHLQEWQQPMAQATEALAIARSEFNHLLAVPGALPLPLPSFLNEKTQQEMHLRLLFSCLVDADFLDTEQHFNSGIAATRAPKSPSLRDLWERFSANQEAMIAGAKGIAEPSEVNRVREAVYRHAINQAPRPRGFFRLTVPTGGGKTRIGLGFGLQHALHHGLRRVIFAIPFTSITDQTAAEYRKILGDADGVVLEHHSGMATDEHADGGDQAETWRRLAAENWDAPVVVTTTVQLFQSLLGKGTSVCRKVHNIAGAVIVLDEAQALPVKLLTPLLDVLRELVAHYGVSVVFCTATQPAFQVIPGFEALTDSAELAPEPPALFRSLRRVTFEWPAPDERLTWEEVAERMREAPRVLAIANTKKDAMALLDALEDEHAFHLSTLLCAAHRRRVLALVRDRLARGEPCRLVSTQVVEAGVDLDFPLVLRVFAPLDSIVQAAGRCNREGQLGPGGGRLVVVEPAESSAPPDYRTGVGIARSLLTQTQGALDLDDPGTLGSFYNRLYQVRDTDPKRVQACRASFDYPETATKARLIDDDTVPVVVRYRGPDGENREVDKLLERLRAAPRTLRGLQRALQPYTVNVWRREYAGLLRQDLMKEVTDGLGIWEWLGAYDAVRGLVPRRDPDSLVF